MTNWGGQDEAGGNVMGSLTGAGQEGAGGDRRGGNVMGSLTGAGQDSTLID